MTVLLIVAALLAGGLFIELVSAATAPLGYQDENGFHFGSDPVTDPADFENPS